MIRKDAPPELNESPLPPPSVERRTGSTGRGARILYSYTHVHLDTGSPRALISVVDGLEARFSPVFLASSEGPLVDALRSRGVEIAQGTTEPLTPRHPFTAAAAVRRKLRLLDSLRIDLIHLHEVG